MIFNNINFNQAGAVTLVDNGINYLLRVTACYQCFFFDQVNRRPGDTGDCLDRFLNRCHAGGAGHVSDIDLV